MATIISMVLLIPPIPPLGAACNKIFIRIDV